MWSYFVKRATTNRESQRLFKKCCFAWTPVDFTFSPHHSSHSNCQRQQSTLTLLNTWLINGFKQLCQKGGVSTKWATLPCPIHMLFNAVIQALLKESQPGGITQIINKVCGCFLFLLFNYRVHTERKRNGSKKVCF